MTPLRSLARGIRNTSELMTPRTVKTTPAGWPAGMKRPASTTSPPGWRTAVHPSGYHVSAAPTERVIWKIADHHPTVIPTAWQKPSSGPQCWTIGNLKPIIAKNTGETYIVTGFCMDCMLLGNILPRTFVKELYEARRGIWMLNRHFERWI